MNFKRAFRLPDIARDRRASCGFRFLNPHAGDAVATVVQPACQFLPSSLSQAESEALT